MRFSDHFRAMDTDVDLEVDCDGLPVALSRIRPLFAREEGRFSRFLPSSQLCRLNAGATVNDRRFAAVCRLALQAHESTGGLFDPFVLPALEAAGYDRPFGELPPLSRRSLASASATNRPSQPPSLPLSARSGERGPGGEGIPLHVDGDSVVLLSGRIDLGGIVKAWTVDQAVALLRSDCEAALVNAGGDLACFGQPDGEGWEVSISGRAGETLWAGQLIGALATSTTARRRWGTADGAIAHHLIDPRTGAPARSPFVQVSARAPHTWWAEAWAKAVLIGGPVSAETAVRHGVSLLTLEHDGRMKAWGDWP